METTPRHILADVLRKSCAREFDDFERLMSGGLNETYLARARSAAPIIVRIARRPTKWFTDEAHAMSLARAVGVPTPDVLGVEHIEHGGALLSFSILSVLPGRPMSEMIGALDESTLASLVEDAGELLAKVQSVTTERGIRHELIERDPQEIEGAVRSVHNTLGRDAAELVARSAELLAERITMRPPTTMLAHGDWLPKHFMIHDDAISGVIDWEFAGPASPAFDLARWQVSAGGPLHDWSSALRRGHARVSELDESDEAWIPLFAIDWALEVLAWKNPASPERFRRCVDVIARYVRP